MHDIDRVRLETQAESETFETGPFEAEQFKFAEAETTSYSGEVFNETEQMELASEMLEITNEAESIVHSHWRKRILREDMEPAQEIISLACSGQLPKEAMECLPASATQYDHYQVALFGVDALFDLRHLKQHACIPCNPAAHERSRLPCRGATRLPSKSLGAFLAHEAHPYGCSR